MKVVLLAGGFGTRLSEYTETIPKPMLKVGSIPILCHLMQIFAHYDHTDFVVPLGYKAEFVKQFFLNYSILNSDFTVNLKSGAIKSNESLLNDWNVSLIDTGLNTMTGGRLLRVKDHVKSETFFLTYGDGLANIDLNELLRFHRRHGKLVTVTGVRPAARFGELTLDQDQVINFAEKPRVENGWVNGGFFVMEPGFLDYIVGDTTVLEKDPLEKAAQHGELMAYRHDDFWQCVDTKRDLDFLNELWDSGRAPWHY